MERLTHIDINCDVGEVSSSENHYVDHLIMPLITSCNIACGGHAGDTISIRETIQLAKEYGVKVGAHPSYPDREHFGRKSMTMPEEELRNVIRKQILRCHEIAESEGIKLTHVKPHGALYNDMAKDEELAKVLVELVHDIDPNLSLFCLANSCVVDVADSIGLNTIQEVFGDRKYAAHDQLMNRSRAGAVLSESEAVNKQVLLFINGQVQVEDGSLEKIKADTICVHSDTPHAFDIVKTIRNQLETNHVRIVAYT